ncbi:MAG: ABC transporter ATP-binding protein [Clostridia bacterium]
MVKVENLKKIYKLSKKQKAKKDVSTDTLTAVNNISFKARNGQIFGLLGPNGAGKTTSLRCISTLIKPSEGKIEVYGFDILEDSFKVRENIALLTNDLKLDENFTPKYTMEYIGSLYGLSKEVIDKRRVELFDYFNVTSYQNMKISELSQGMKQKLSIAVSLVHDPKVIIFDEPTNGLDVITAKAVTDYLLKLKQLGKTIIISTHIMNVAAKLCDRIAILLNGEICINDNLENILLKTKTNNLEEAFFKLYEQEVGEII